MMKRKNIAFLFSFISFLALSQSYTGNVGVNTSTPTQNLDINGDVAGSKLTSNLSDLSSTGLVVLSTSDGTLKAVPKNKISPLVTENAGTIISTGSEFIVAQEFYSDLSADQTINSTTPQIITNLNAEVFDNMSLYNNGSFQVKENGTYVILISLQISANTALTNPFIGVRNLTNNTWICGVNDSFTAFGGSTGNKTQNYFMYSGVDLVKGINYAFAAFSASSTESFTIKKDAIDSSGSGMVSSVMLRRLK